MRIRVGGFSAFLLAILAGCGGGGGGGGGAIPASTPRAIGQALPPNPSFEVTASGTSDDWPTYAHDTFRTAFEPNASQITQHTVGRLQVAWTYQSSSAFVASPILYNGTLYVIDHLGQLTALDALTGSIKWQRQMGQYMEMTPAIYDGILFVGLHDYPSQLTALDPANGAKLWAQTVPGGLQGSPVAVNGVVYAGVALGDAGFCHAGGIYTFDEKTGSPRTIWLTDKDPQPDGGGVWAPLSYDGKQVLYGTGNTCQNAPATANSIVSIAPDMSDLWHISTAPANDDDDVGGGVLVLGSNGYVIGKNGSLYAVDLDTGQTLWSQRVNPGDGLGGHATPAYTESTLIVSGGYGSFPGAAGPPPGGTLYGLGVDGTTRWQIKSNWPVTSYIATTPDLAFATLDNTIAALEPATGKTLWSYPTAGLFHGGVVVSMDHLYAADMSGKVYGFKIGQSTSSTRRFAVHAVHVSGSLPLIPAYCRL